MQGKNKVSTPMPAQELVQADTDEEMLMLMLMVVLLTKFVTLC